MKLMQAIKLLWLSALQIKPAALGKAICGQQNIHYTIVLFHGDLMH